MKTPSIGKIQTTFLFCVLFAIFVHADPAPPAFRTVITTDADPSVTNHAHLTEFRSINGVLALDISATYDSNNPNGAIFPTPPDGSSPAYYRLAYSCKYTGSKDAPVVSYAGPFLRVQPGDHVIINFTNNLKVERTNVHFHGLGITPKIGTSEGLDYGDYVNLPYVNFVDPGTYRQFDFYIPKEQRQGLYLVPFSRPRGCGNSGRHRIERTTLGGRRDRKISDELDCQG